jgi:hypothetical protein
MRRLPFPLLLAALASLAVPGAVGGHAERHSYFPNHRLGKVPPYRTSGPSLVVCKPDSRQRILRSTSVRGLRRGSARRSARLRLRRKNLVQLERCRYRHIQAAVGDARNGSRILVLPGVYREEPSRRVPSDDSRCQGARYEGEERGTKTYAYQRDCPNAQNLITIAGDDNDPDRRCDDKCRLQIEGPARTRATCALRAGGTATSQGRS